jgi:ubiquinone/menaquinone biosynthesis C-methylase UbiE
MHTPSDQNESANTYVLDAEGAAEMVRLTKQDHLVTKYMGGLLPPQAKLEEIHSILDVACGPGGWALEVAFEHPDIQVMGIDISSTLIDYANARAKTQELEDNVAFEVMDAAKPLDFPDASFDFVNARFLIGFMGTTSWSNFIQECVRITRPGGLLRLIECEDMGTTTSPAFEKLWGKCARAFRLAGRSFSPEGRNFNITPMLVRFMRDAGYQNIQTIPHVIDFSAGAEAHMGMFEDWTAGLKLLQPFLLKMKVATQEEADELYQMALAEMLEDGFSALWYFLSVIGERPS